MTYGHSLYDIRSQPLLHKVTAASVTHGCRQLYTHYCLPSHEDAARLAHELLAEGARAAAEVAHVVAESVERWRLRLRGGRVQLSDTTLGMRHGEDPEDSSSVLLRWTGDSERSSGERSSGERSSGHVVKLFHGHYAKLEAAYEAAGHPRGLMLARMFAVVCRYDGLSEDKSAYQAALPRR